MDELYFLSAGGPVTNGAPTALSSLLVHLVEEPAFRSTQTQARVFVFRGGLAHSNP